MATVKQKIMVCNDCFQPIVNGDFSALDYWYRPKQARERMEAVKDGMNKLTANGEHLALGDKRVEFAKSPCECCGSTLHGERHEIIVLQSSTIKDGKK